MIRGYHLEKYPIKEIEEADKKEKKSFN